MAVNKRLDVKIPAAYQMLFDPPLCSLSYPSRRPRCSKDVDYLSGVAIEGDAEPTQSPQR